MDNPEYIDLMERAIDANGLQETVQMLSTICWEKATHVLTNWQDQKLAKQWEAAAKVLERASVNQAVITIS